MSGTTPLGGRTASGDVDSTQDALTPKSNVRDLAFAVGAVHGHDDEAEPERGHVGDDDGQRRLRARDHPVAGREADARQPAGHRA